MGVSAQADNARPRLVVGIVVDQLRTDYIEYLQSYFGERGFRTLLTDAVYMRDVDFKVPGLDGVNATAMLFTGAYPSQTGVPAASVFDVSTGQGTLRLPLAGSGQSVTNDSFTPAGLRLSTVADELVIDGGGAPQVYSVAMDPQQAVIMAGHVGKGAFWVNNASGNWATTSYYGPMPSAVSQRNFRNSLAQRIDTMQWRPSTRLAQVAGLPTHKKTSPFRYTFSRQDRDVYKKFAASALSNAEVTDVAIDLLRNLNLGQNPGETDMLNVAYTLAPFKYVSDGMTRAELTDAYLRLDAQLSRLIEAVDRTVGERNSVIWLTSTGYYDDAVAVEEKYRLPGGEFSARKARSLLNSYLSAKFGAGQYVSAIREGQVYFDRHTLESMRLDPTQVIDDARTFIAKMSGVADAITVDDILSPRTDEERALRLAVDPRTCGDIIIRFAPGWSVAYDEQTPVQTKYTRESAVMTPAFFRVPGVAPRTISTTVDAVSLAPTLSGAIRIRAPNGAGSRGIELGTR